ncbi:regulator of MON1-CCZ1 complex isoform X1 [Bombus vosnesenskii]|uniref:Regulator of MON1-CCZ1 complex isoform X1 n=1 Tax=Bombus vosnesenskii TaxID=207650 RepID=A0A6J3KWH2_9HYME|nr:regulator of MON1-CCZ1 complex isoform X1 [Bombus vosnesenskii]
MEAADQYVHDDYYLELSSDPIRFESVSCLTNVFFDDSKQQVFAVRSGGVTGVLVKGPNQNLSFRMEDKGPVISIKFSPDMNILAVQHNNSSVEFINYSPVAGLDNIEYSQSCKGKNATILGFVWTHGNEILFVTDYGVELFQVNPEKRNVRFLKCLSLGVNWFVFCPQSYLVLLSSGTVGNQMQTLHVTPGNLHKLTKFEVEVGTAKPGKLAVYERDVALTVLYGIPCIILLRHQPGTNRSTGAASVYIYTVHNRMTTIKRSHILKLDVSGKFAINVVDNLIIVHHQTTKTSMIFDIMLSGISDGTVMHHTSMAPAKPIKPYCLKVPGTTLSNETYQPCQLYSPNWVVFQPNIIIDAKLGCLWYIELKLESLTRLITDKVLLVEFLMQRTNTKYILIHVLQNFMMQLPISLMDMPIIFNKLNSVYRNYLENEIQNQMGTPLQNNAKCLSTTTENYKYKLLLDQSDVYSYILSKFPENTIEPKMIVWVLLEYIRSLAEHSIPVQHYLHELVITTLVQRKAYYQLHQLLQYHVVADSKPLACLLLSLENLYPAAHQLALDMLKRLGNAHEEIIEVLLSKGYILPALRYIRSVGMVDQVSDRKFLEAAKATEDATLFYSVFKFFKQRNLYLYNTTGFTKGERYQPYIQHYKYLFEGIDNGCNSDTNSNVTTISS